MSKILTKCVPALLTSAVLSASAGCFVAGAECTEESIGSASVSSAALVAEVEAMQTFGEISSEEAQMLLEEIAAVQSSNATYTYVDYDYYASSAISPTTHYLAILAEEGTSIGSCYIDLFFNTNLLDNTYLSDDRLTVGSSYTSTSKAVFDSSESVSTSVRNLVVHFTTSLAKAPDSKELFVYDFGDSYLKLVENEAELHSYTSRSSTSPSSIITNSKDYELRKCVYSLGDVDRDGDIDTDDVSMVSSFILAKTSGSAINEAAFILAADVDKDGKVTAEDSLLIMRCAAGLTTL